MWDRMWINADIATMAAHLTAPYGVIRDAALAVDNGRIAWIGARANLPGSPGSLARTIEDAERAWILPGLIDCHTHLVFAGNRAAEFEQRLLGVSYEDIARRGGGIAATVRATRAASLDQLLAESRPRLDALRRSGVTTVEIKSGYGLEPIAEIRMLEAAGRLGHTGNARIARIARTFLGLHAVPPDCDRRRIDYLDEVCEVLLPEIAERGLAEAVDAFCEGIGFAPAEVRRYFEKAQALGFNIKLHADQLSDLGGAELAAGFYAISADHLEYSSEQGIRAMREAGVVAVLLPGAFYSLGETRKPPLALLRKYRVPIAIGTDLNPGTSPLCSAPLAMNMACTLFGLTPPEAIAGMTLNAAKALQLDEELGSLERGKFADFGLWRIEHPAEICYWIGLPGPERSVIAGEAVMN